MICPFAKKKAEARLKKQEEQRALVVSGENVLDINITIKTHNRVDVLRQKTLKVLLEGGINPAKIWLVVGGEDQFELYKPLALEYPGITIRTMPKAGIQYAVEEVRTMFAPGVRVIHMDDDVEAIEENVGGKLQPVKDLNAVFQEGFWFMEQNNTELWGLYPVRNAFFMKAENTSDLKFIWAGFYGFVSNPDPDLKTSCKMKDDFERSILYFKKFGAVARLNRFCCKTKFWTTSGGTAGQDRERLHLADAEYLANAYPQYATLRKKKGFGGVDVSLRHKKNL